jgi:hypothetical protein
VIQTCPRISSLGGVSSRPTMLECFTHSWSMRAVMYGTQPRPASASTSRTPGCRSSTPENTVSAIASSSCIGDTVANTGSRQWPPM